MGLGRSGIAERQMLTSPREFGPADTAEAALGRLPLGYEWGLRLRLDVTISGSKNAVKQFPPICDPHMI